MGIPWYILTLPILAYSVLGTTLDPGKSDLIKNLTKIGDNPYTMYLSEDNHIEGSTPLLLFSFKDVLAKAYPSCVFLTNSTFQHEITPISDSEYQFIATQDFDYETQAHNYQMKCNVGSDIIVVLIYIVNYDDEQPTLTSPMCSMSENVNYTEENTNCTCILQDLDGWLSQTEFTVINSNPTATKDLNMENKLFKFDFDKSIADDVYSTTVYITTLQQLDYETKIFYSFDVQAKDGAGHSTSPNENVKCIIDVEDQNDEPPQWTDYFTSQEITEKTPYNYTITAVDGDRGINADIIYSLVSYDENVCGAVPCITIDTQDGNGVITVKPIDRDAMDLTTYKFRIMAQEVDKPPYTVDLNITFFIDDIDDNSPLFMSLATANDSSMNINYTNVEIKIAEFTFYENFASTIDSEIEITDIDSGANAQFKVVLKEDDSQNNGVQYTDAFSVVPTAGFRTGKFQISVKNATYLDYENPPWQNFQFYVHSYGNNASKEDDLLVKIHLLDYNDEKPIFAESAYSVTVDETIGKGEKIIQVKATDRDAADKVLTHQLVAADAILKLLEIDAAEGIITVGIKDAFDYDRLNPIIFQVKAIDHAVPPHETIVPVTITLHDINNKAPTYAVLDVIRVDENQVIGIELNSSITASDVDTTRNLTARIDWNSSYVTKNSQRLNSSNPVIEKAMKFLDLSYNITLVDTILITLTVSDNNEEQTAPDYETFDTLYLDIHITDLNTKLPEFVLQMSIDAIIVININDINDNPPIFTEETITKNRTVYEMAKAGALIDPIKAIDADVGDHVDYSCKYIIKEYDWFACDLDGGLTVAYSEKIDCDADKIHYVNISCIATDGFFHTPHDFSIYIKDTNNKFPQIEVNDSSPSASTVHVNEKSEQYTIVTNVGYSDADRDIPFHTAVCTLSGEYEECFEQFTIKNNQVLVKAAGHRLDRDTGTPVYDCSVSCTDNPKSEQGEPQKTNDSIFTIILLDINDHWPELQTLNLTTSENVKKNTLIGNVIAKDIDDGLNADIDMKILTVIRDDGSDYTDKKLFDIVKNDTDYEISKTLKQWHLVTLQDLRDLYGEYTVQLEVSDLGTPRRSSEDNSTLREDAKLKVTISKYNYYAPKFVYPTADDLNLVLTSSQEVGKPLVKYLDNEILPDIAIADGKDDKCIDKWDPVFEVSLTGSSSDLVNIFVVKNVDRCTAQLQVNQNYKKGEITNYEVTLTVKLSENTPSDDKEAAYIKAVTLNVNFADPNVDPIFNSTLGVWNITMEETNINRTQPLPLERKAFYPNVYLNVTAYYSLYSNNINITNTFDVEPNTGTLKLKQELDYLIEQYYEFKILAARNQSGVVNPNPLSLLDVTLWVEDVNNHVPQWTEESFFGAIMISSQKSSIIKTAAATDLDVIDKDKLKYTINSTIERNGSQSIFNIKEPFKYDETSGAIILNFKVESNMDGHFLFWIKVEDAKDRFGNGPHENRTTMTIYIVTDDNTLTFKFENSLDNILNNTQKITDTISNVFGWKCHDYSIDHDSQNGVVLDNVTACSIYCVNNNTLLTSSDIKAKLNNINTFKALKQGLMQSGVLLQNFDSDATQVENLETTLKAALIGVSVVLGAICIILAITFFLKARELNRRLKHLTEQKFGSDESNLNRKGINAPTTNVFAVEGSNPVFNNEVKRDDYTDYDKRSINSGDSELIGVEDNPEFDGMFTDDNDNDKERF